jgi:hypothetical protein
MKVTWFQNHVTTHPSTVVLFIPCGETEKLWRVREVEVMESLEKFRSIIRTKLVRVLIAIITRHTMELEMTLEERVARLCLCGERESGNRDVSGSGSRSVGV